MVGREDGASQQVPAVALALILMGPLLGVLPVYLTSALSVAITRDIALAMTDVGWTVFACFASAGMSSIWCGRLVGAIGTYPGLQLAALISASAMLVGSLAQDLTSFIAVGVLGGLGNSIAQPATNAGLIGQLARKHYGLFFGTKQASIPAAALIGGALGSVFTSESNWRVGFLVASMLAVLYAALLVVLRGSAPGLGRRAGDSRRPPVARTDRKLIYLTVASGLGAAVGNTTTVFLVPGAVAAGMAERGAGLVLILVSLAGALSRIGASVASDKFQLNRVSLTIVAMSLGALGTALMATGIGSWYVVGSWLMLGLGWSWSGLIHLEASLSDRRGAARATGLLQTGVFAGSALGPVIFGWVAVEVSTHAGWLMTAGGALLAVLLFRKASTVTRKATTSRR